MTKKKLIALIILIVAFFQVYSEDYYWVGGQGDWSDLNSWRTITGSIPNEVPDAVDNVIFNQNSFLQDYDTVFILTGNPVCNNMTFVNIQDTVVIVGGSANSTFSIYGSVTLHPMVINDYMGRISFMSDNPGNTITCAGTIFHCDIWFEGEGEWILQDTLFVHDSTSWEAIIYDFIEPLAPNPVIVHDNGTFNANGQTIITRGFQTTGNKTRSCLIQDCDILMVGNWILGAENLTFSAANSYILIGGNINNSTGELISYYDIDVMPVDGGIKNTDIRTYMRKVHFLGGGSLDGKKTPGIEGSFTIDTLIMEGAWTMAGPIPNEIKGVFNNIHYTQINQTMGYVETDKSQYHRIDYNCIIPSFLKGYENVIDSIHFFVPEGALAGDNIVNDLLFFNTTGVLSSWITEHSTVEHAVFSGDGFISGSNTINLLTLNSGYWCQLAADSLSQPGSYYTNTHIQTINQIEVISDCINGLSRLSSNSKETQAIINYTGGVYPTEYLMVEDVKNIGSVVNISNGIDLGNNDGFNFTNPLGSRNLYWVGGDGEWNDMIHWSLISGGTGGECPPTIFDNVFFDNLSGFADSGMVVNVNVKHASFNDMTWDNVTNLPTLLSLDTAGNLVDTCSFHIWGSLKLDPSMSFLFFGKVFFESQDDNEWETIDLTYTLETDPGVFEIYNWLFNQVYFYGRGGKWQFDSKYVDYYDTTFVKMGTILLENDTMICFNFNSDDTLRKGIYFMGNTHCEVHQYQADAWLLNAFGSGYNENPMVDMDTTFAYNFGNSVIRSYGDISPPMGAPPGFGNIRTFAGEVKYHNIEFSDPDVSGIRSILISESKCYYNLVDYYIMYGDGVGNGVIDTLTYKKVIDTLTGLTVVSADGCKLRNNYYVNFVMAESFGDTLIGNHVIDTAFFFDDGALFGYHQVGYLQADKFMHMILGNRIDTAVLYGNGAFSGSNQYIQLVLSPNKRYLFQHDLEDPSQLDTTKIYNDLIMEGYCDEPIRIQSDSIGTQAYILYKAQQPTNTTFTAKYASMRDITMVPFNNNQYIAESSVNLGNNTNWTWTNATDEIYYWVNGTGDWGDWGHWSYTSGGPAITAECTPKEINTVIFDDNSFFTPADTVTVDVLNAYCKNMYWKHSGNFKPVFIGADTTVLYIYGSVEFSDSMDYEYAGLIYFDQFEESNFVADTITSRGKLILNDIRFQGIDDVVLLGDDLTLLVDPGNNIFRSVYLEHGNFTLNGKHLSTGGLFSVFKNQRTLNIENSKATVKYDFDRAWWIDGDNLQFFADKSTIYNESFMGTIFTEYGNNLQYYNIELNGPVDSLANKSNITEYNLVSINQESGLVTGNFIADTVYLRGRNSGMFNKSTTNVVYIDSLYGSINQKHNINRCFVNRFGFVRGNNNFKYCVFNDDGVFMGHNVFDTLVLYPGSGNSQGLGNWFYFQADSTQVVNDSLYVRGNQCSNISITSLSAPKLAYIKKDNGYDLASDYLNIYSVAAVHENIEFYAGANSTPLPNPDNPPPGWVFENAQGYIYGFNGKTDRFCLGTEFVIDATNFNGDANTLYFWEGSPFPGDITYTVTQPGTYHVKIQYFEGCTVDDYIVVEASYPPLATIDPGPFCEGDIIHVNVSPDNNAYKYSWFNGETSSQIIAELDYNGGIFVQVIDTTNNCEASPNQNIVVKPAPKPEQALGDDITLVYGESITLDAGVGDTYTWTSNPEVPIETPNSRTITIHGYTNPNPVEYQVNVDLNGCPAEGYKLVGMFPPSKWGVPTAFSPNGDDDNDVLYVYGSGFKELVFRIYDRYGKLVFETTNPDRSEGWDGTVNGVKQEMEVYTYYLKIIFEDEGVVEDKGNITLLR
jgi:gliding motility-associated-like protein